MGSVICIASEVCVQHKRGALSNPCLRIYIDEYAYVNYAVDRPILQLKFSNSSDHQITEILENIVEMHIYSKQESARANITKTSS